MIKGESIILIETAANETDPFGADVVTENEVRVDNVLVGNPSTEAVTTELQMTGKHIAFVLGIPKGDAHNWKDKMVIIRGERYKSFGFPLTQTEANVPGLWNTQVKVERYE